ncbi:endonuclease domain-containing protein [Zhouia sp. CL16]|nr:endonuclease domain-containing protein [Zhouia amylolytica]
MWKGAKPESFSKAKLLRERMTKAENMLWDVLRDKKFMGYKFRRQHPIQNYIVDFYCHELKMVIEVDGDYHNSKEQKCLDKEREEEIVFQGLRIIRFTNQQVISNIANVLDWLKDYIENK